MTTKDIEGPGSQKAPVLVRERWWIISIYGFRSFFYGKVLGSGSAGCAASRLCATASRNTSSVSAALAMVGRVSRCREGGEGEILR
jgi:hypothetical protein